MPLVYAGAKAGALEPVTEAHERARKIKPQYAEGEVVQVAWARNQAEAELLQGMLLEEGVPSVQRRAPGFDVPDFLAAGPRHILVPASGEAAAREVLLQAGATSAGATGSASPLRLLLALLVGVGVIALLVWLGTQVS
jgi:hypothetical protein